MFKLLNSVSFWVIAILTIIAIGMTQLGGIAQPIAHALGF